MVRILGQRSLRIIYFNYGKSELDNDIQLSVELARAIGHSTLTTISEEMFEYLISHRNKQIVVQLVESLQRHDEYLRLFWSE